MKTRTIVGWISISISVITACFWAFWGIIENFHEGWYSSSLKQNLMLMFFQYLSPMIITIALSLLAIWHNRIGAVLFFTIGILLSFYVNNAIVSLPLVIIGVLYWFSDFKAKKWKYRLSILLPLFTLLVCGIEPIVRLSARVNDGDFGSRTITQNGISLIWAPQGPGWPTDGTNWHTADSICTHLSEDGLSIESEPQHIWRLPSVEEAVKSMQRHAVNSKGRLNAQGKPEYEIRPDKETPLWNPHSKVIYWWTKTEIDEKKAYMIVYDGKIWERNKNFKANYLGFRAVKDKK